MVNMFQNNLKKLTEEYSQKYIAAQTGFSQSSINNYLFKGSEPSIQFLIALKDAFGICVDDFLFSDFNIDKQNSNDKFIGNYIVYYYNNNSYRGEVHNSFKNVLNYGIISVYKEKELDNDVQVIATFSADRWEMVKRLNELNSMNDAKNITRLYETYGNIYYGNISNNDQSIFIDIKNHQIGDQVYIILNNPPSKLNTYIGGIGTVNSVARGREHNPCIQYIILSKNVLDVPEGEIYDYLRLYDYMINLDTACDDMINLFKRLYITENEISIGLSEEQKEAIIKNKLEYHFKDVLEANVFRFAKISNKEDDTIYKLIKEG